MAQNEEFMRRVKAANPIEDVMRLYVNLERRGNNYVCSCPFHSEKTPSCTVYTDTQNFYCFGCGAGGDVITFIMKLQNLEFYEALKELAQRAGLQMPNQTHDNNQARQAKLKDRIYEINRISANFFYLNMIKGTDKRGLQYFIERGLTPQTIKKYGLGYASESWYDLYNHLKSKDYNDYEITQAWVCTRSKKNNSIFDIFRNRVMFPIVNAKGSIIGFGGRVLDDSKPKYLNTNKTPVFDKGDNLFSLNLAKESSFKQLILCEGYMDVIALNQAGFDNAIATLGTAITPSQARLMGRYCKEILICYDSDTAGQIATQKAINHLDKVGINAKIISMENAKDPDEFIKKFGATRFKLLMDKATDATTFLIESCKRGLDLNTINGKNDFTKLAAKVILKIEDPIKQNLYISQTCETTNLDISVLKSHLEKQNQRNEKFKAVTEWNTAVNNVTYKVDNINPEATTHKREDSAEKMIIIYLLKNPEECENIGKSAFPEIFVTEFNKKIYSILLEKFRNIDQFNSFSLAEEFSVDEMSRITEMEVKYRNIEINKKVFSDCVDTLKNYHKYKSNSNNEMLDLNSLAEKFKFKNNK